MFGHRNASATVAVRNIGTARKFYEEKLGLKPGDQGEPGVIVYGSGDSLLFVYESQYAGTNQATSVTWVVGDDIAKIASDLKARGVAFEHYDFPDTAREGDVHVTGRIKAAWFKDPDGNIHAIVSG